MVAAAPTVPAPATHHMALNGDTVTHTEDIGPVVCLHAITELHDSAEELVADDLPGRDMLSGEIVPGFDVEVCPAQPRLEHFDLYFTDAGRGLGNILQL